MAKRSQRSEFSVGDWTVSPSLGRIQRNSQRVSLEPLAMALLVYLAEHANELVTTNDLIAEVWNDQIVSDSTIYFWIHKLRKALGDDSRQPRYIETVPKKGYRIVARIRGSQTHSVSASESVFQRWTPRVAAAALVISIATVAYIVQQELIGIGQRENTLTTNDLAYNFYQSGNDYLRRGDNQTVHSLAAQQFQHAVDEDPEFVHAWAALSRAHAATFFFGVDPTDERLARARSALDKAIHLAPDLPETHLAEGYYYYYGFRDFQSALQQFNLAQPGMQGEIQFYMARGHIHRRLGDFHGALADFLSAAVIDPRSADVLSSLVGVYKRLRDYDEAEIAIDRLLDMAPDFPGAQVWKAEVPLYRDGDPLPLRQATLEGMRMELSTRLPAWTAAIYDQDYPAALSYLDGWEDDLIDGSRLYRPKASYRGLTYHLAGMPALAEEQFHAAREKIDLALKANEDDPRLLVAFGEIMAHLDNKAEAIELARNAIELLTDAATGHEIRLEAIMVLVAAGDYDSAVRELHTYLSSPGFWTIDGLLPDPRLDPIRSYPQFEALAQNYTVGLLK